MNVKVINDTHYHVWHSYLNKSIFACFCDTSKLEKLTLSWIPPFLLCDLANVNVLQLPTNTFMKEIYERLKTVIQ